MLHVNVPGSGQVTYLAIMPQQQPSFIILEVPAKHRFRVGSSLVNESIDDAVECIPLQQRAESHGVRSPSTLWGLKPAEQLLTQ